jgi:HlyD family secretion protein
MTQRRLVTLVVLVVIALAAVAVLRRGPRPTPVDVDTVRTRDILASIVTASGEIVAVRYADIGSTVMGRIVELPVAEGDQVRAGQLLARLDAVPAQSDADAAAAGTSAIEADRAAAAAQQTAARADLARARARSVEAMTALARAEALSQQGLSPAADLDAARATADAAAADVAAAEAAITRAEQALAAATRRVAQARAQQARAQDVLEKTEIRAPIDGVVSRLQVRQGEMVVIGIQNQPGTTLMTVSDLAQVNAEVKVAEADVLRLAIGQPATVVLEALPGRTFPGRVVEVGASALPVVGTGAAAREFRVRVRLDEPDPGLRPGLTCDADILTDERRNVTTVPLQAVALRDGAGGGQQSGVFVLRDDRAVFTPVRTGIIGGLDMEVSGLAPGTPIIVGPFQTLRELTDGAAVRAATAGR